MILRHFDELTRRDGTIIMSAHWAWTNVYPRTDAERRLMRTMFASEPEAIEARDAKEQAIEPVCMSSVD
jgi:hypothetical protein